MRKTEKQKQKQKQGSVSPPIDRTIARHALIAAAALLLISTVQWAFLYVGVPFEKFFTFWFWPHTSKPWGSGVLFFFIPAATLAMCRAVSSKLSVSKKLALLTLFGFFLQLGFGYLEGRGITAVEDRMVKAGHAQFAVNAVVLDDTWDMLCNFEDLLAQNKLNKFAKSKPPGQMLLYLATERAARAVFNGESPRDRFFDMVRFSAWVWTFISCLTIIPLFFWARRILDELSAFRAALFFLLFPAVNLVNLHTDQVFFPLFFMLCLAAAQWSAARRSPWTAALPGIAIYLAVFFSFALAAVVPFVVYTFWMINFDRTRLTETRVVRAVRFGIRAAVMTAAALLTDLIFFSAFNYRISVRFSNAVTHHRDWKSFLDIEHNGGILGLLNLFEFFYWAGWSVTAIFVFVLIRTTIYRIQRKVEPKIEILALLFSALSVYLAFFANTAGETARLWIFLLPILSVFVAHGLGATASRRLFPLLACLQVVTTFFFKLFQDFY